MKMELNEAIQTLNHAGLIAEKDAYMDSLDKEDDEYMLATKKSNDDLDALFDLAKKSLPDSY